MLRCAFCQSAMLLLACSPGKLPGLQVGTYDVHSMLSTNTCGANALPAIEMLDFAVEIRRDGEVGLWFLNGSTAAVSGSLYSDGTFSFVQSSQYTAIEPTGTTQRQEEPWDYWGDGSSVTGGDPGCVLVTHESVSGQLHRGDSQVDAGEDFSLVGRNEIRVSPLPGSRCLAVLAIEGGPFERLPCDASFQLIGRER